MHLRRSHGGLPSPSHAGGILRSEGHKVKIHKITPATGKEGGDLELKDYVVLQKPQEQADRLPPPRTLILDFTMTHPQYDRSVTLLNLNGQLTNTRCSDGAPEPDGVIKVVDRKKIIHYRQLYIDRPDPIAFMSVAVDTSDHIYDDFLRLLFLHVHREVSTLANDIPVEESGHFRFLRATCLVNIKGSVGLVLTKSSVMRISIPLDLSSRPSIPPPCFIHSRRPTTLLTPSLVFSPLRSA